MIYLKTSVGIELRGDDMLISSLQSNVSAGVFTHFTRIREYRLRSLEDVRQEINTFFKSSGLSKESIVLGIPRKDIVLRFLDLPAEVADNLKQVVQYQVQSFEPTEEDRYYHDYALLPGSEPAAKKLRIMLVMVRKATLDEALRFLEGVGIRPVAVTGSSVGLMNLFLQTRGKDQKGKNFVLADVAPSSLEVVALRDGSLAYSHQLPVEPEVKWKDLVLREIAEAASKIRLGPEETLEKIVLSGESAESACQEIRADIPDCELMQNCIGIEIPNENQYVVQEAASSLGLAYTGMVRRPPIRLNLLPPERRLHQSRWAYVPAAVLALIILALLAGFGFHRAAQNQRLIEKLDEELSRLKGPVARVQAYRRESEELGKKVKSMEEILAKKDMNLELLKELTTLLPPDTYLTTYRNQEGTITLTGRSGSASDLLPKLEKSPLLKNVVSKGAVYRDNQTGKEVVTFEAKLER